MVARMLRCSWRPLFEFELLFKLLALTVFTPVFSLSVRGVMAANGYDYLTVDNIGPFLQNPITWVLLFVVILLVAFYVLLDIGAILYAVDQGRLGCRADLPSMLRAAWRAAWRVFRPRNWPLAVMALVLLPVLNIGILPGFISTVAVPEAVEDLLSKHPGWVWGAAAVLVALTVLVLRWLYVFHFYALQGCPFRKARRRSIELGRGSRLRDLLTFGALQMAGAIFFAILVMALLAGFVFLSKLFTESVVLDAVLMGTVWVTLSILLLLFSVLSVPVGFGCISALFYVRMGQKGYELPQTMAVNLEHRKGSRWLRTAEAAVLLLSVAFCAYYAYQASIGETNFNVEYVRTMEVTAHRGASKDFPENTMPAFEGALEMGADWIELDVQQTRDGVLIVMHDSNLRRTTGDPRNIWEVDFKEVAQLDAGGWFASEYEGTPIPTLAEVLEWARDNDMRLNIELKPTGHETEFAQSVVDLVRNFDYMDRCVITSQSYETLQQVRDCDEEVQTVYVMAVAYGNLLKLKAADTFSVKSINITSSMVGRLHNAQKQLYAWTVNSEKSMEKMVQLGVDNIITDNVPMAKAVIYANKTSGLVQRYLEFLENF